MNTISCFIFYLLRHSVVRFTVVHSLILFFQLADQLYQTMSKRFSQSKKVWVGFGAFYMKQGKLDLGRKLLQRSLKSLPKRKRK